MNIDPYFMPMANKALMDLCIPILIKAEVFDYRKNNGYFVVEHTLKKRVGKFSPRTLQRILKEFYSVDIDILDKIIRPKF